MLSLYHVLEYKGGKFAVSGWCSPLSMTYILLGTLGVREGKGTAGEGVQGRERREALKKNHLVYQLWEGDIRVTI